MIAFCKHELELSSFSFMLAFIIRDICLCKKNIQHFSSVF